MLVFPCKQFKCIKLNMKGRKSESTEKRGWRCQGDPSREGQCSDILWSNSENMGVT